MNSLVIRPAHPEDYPGVSALSSRYTLCMSHGGFTEKSINMELL